MLLKRLECDGMLGKVIGERMRKCKCWGECNVRGKWVGVDGEVRVGE